ncbi:MAG: DNA/RNA non-specific endonuclease [Chloroflexales bacterium]
MPTPTTQGRRLLLALMVAWSLLIYAPSPSPVAAADRTATVTHGGNLRKEPRVAPATVIGQVCPGDQMTITRTSVVGQTTWAYGTISALAPSCDPKRVAAGTTGWLSLTLLALNSAAPATTAAPSTPAPSAPPASLHLALGNPSGAVANASQPNNYLIIREQYALAYSRDRGIPAWVSWHVAATDLGATARYSGSFITDTSLPAGWYRVTHNDYTGSGYDRGHMAPAGDRTASAAANEATFILTNVLPQSAANNQGPWNQLENYARELVGQGNELYVIAGGAGSQQTLAKGKLTVPAATWKLMVVLPNAPGDAVTRLTPQTQVIAVWMPNTAEPRDQAWTRYTTTGRCLEERTGLQLLSAVPASVRTALLGAGCGAAPPPAVATAAPPAAATAAPPAAATAAPLPAAPPAATAANLTIPYIVYNPPGDDMVGEYVLLRNSGGSPATLTGWTLRDAAKHVYTFPVFTLAAGAEVRLWTKGGGNDASNLYWGQPQPVWNNTGGDTAILRDSRGTEVTRFTY